MDQAANPDTTQTVTSSIESTIHSFAWFDVGNNLVYYIAIAIGFFIIFVSYFFAGGRKSKMRIIMAITIGTLVGVFTMPLLLKIAGTQSDPVVIGFLILLDMIFVATVTCHLYEMVIIGTHEAFTPPR
mgnify:FL=1